MPTLHELRCTGCDYRAGYSEMVLYGADDRGTWHVLGHPVEEQMAFAALPCPRCARPGLRDGMTAIS